MSTINRRQFIKKGMLGIGSAALLSQLPLNGFSGIPTSHPRHPVGFQVYTIREMLVKDFPGTLAMMAQMGYETVEMCSPTGYITSGFHPLAKMKPEVMQKIFKANDLTCESSHFTFHELQNNPEERINYSNRLGLKQMIVSGFGLPEKATMNEWLNACDQLNEIGLKTVNSGLKLGYFNHHMEFEKIDGELIYDALLKQLDPNLIKMQFQVAVINIGYKASSYFLKYPGRFISTHMADWSSAENKPIAIGKGDIDWREFYNAAEIGVVKNYYVEMDQDKFKDSVDFIHAM